MLLVMLTSAWAASTSSLSWVRLDGAEACVAAPDLARAVEERVGRSVFVAPSVAEVAVEGRVEPAQPGWRAVVRMTDRAGSVLGERVVESRAERCDELGRVAAVTIALMIDPLGMPPSEEPVAVAPPEPVEAPRWGVELGSSLTGGWGAVPGVGVGGVGLVRVDPPGFVPVVALGEIVPFARSTADFMRMVGGVQICPLAVSPGVARLDGCLGLDAGAMLVVGGGEALAATEEVLAQGHAALHARWRVVGPLLVRTGLHVTVPFRRVEFVLDDAPETTVYRAAPVAGYADMGLGLEF